MRDLWQGFWVVGGSLDVVVLLGLGLLVGGIGGLAIYDARQLRRVRLLFDHRGVSLADHPPVTVPWDSIRHIAVTAGKPGWRRLLVDDGRMSEQWWSAATIHPGRAQLRLLARRRRFLVNLPIDRLDQDAHLIVSEIHHHSGGRFPDRGTRQLAA